MFAGLGGSVDRRPRALFSFRPYSEQDSLPLTESDILAIVDVFCGTGGGDAQLVWALQIAHLCCTLRFCSLFSALIHVL